MWVDKTRDKFSRLKRALKKIFNATALEEEKKMLSI